MFKFYKSISVTAFLTSLNNENDGSLLEFRGRL